MDDELEVQTPAVENTPSTTDTAPADNPPSDSDINRESVNEESMVETASQDTSSEPRKKLKVNREVPDLIAKARQEEKDKLYPQIKALKEENDFLKTKNSELEAEITRLTSELEEVKNIMGELDKQQQSLEALEAKLKADFQKELDERERKYQVELHKQKVLSANAGKLIPELVTGSTIEEIDAAVERAKARFEEIRQSVLNNEVPPPPPPLPPVGNPAETSPAIDLSNIRGMSREEYAAKRKLLKTQILREGGYLS